MQVHDSIVGRFSLFWIVVVFYIRSHSFITILVYIVDEEEFAELGGMICGVLPVRDCVFS